MPALDPVIPLPVRTGKNLAFQENNEFKAIKNDKLNGKKD
jgi:hypothetical protein